MKPKKNDSGWDVVKNKKTVCGTCFRVFTFGEINAHIYEKHTEDQGTEQSPQRIAADRKWLEDAKSLGFDCERDMLKYLYMDMSTNCMAKFLGNYSPRTVCLRMERYGLKRQNFPTLTEERRQLIRWMYEDGYLWRQIVAECGVSASTVRSVCSDLIGHRSFR